MSVFDRISVDWALKAMLHKAIFIYFNCNLQRNDDDWKQSKLQMGCHTLVIFVRNLQCTRWKWSSWNPPWAKDVPWLAHFNKIVLQVAPDMSQAAAFLATLQKVEHNIFFLHCSVLLHLDFFGRRQCNVNLLHCKLQEKLPRRKDSKERKFRFYNAWVTLKFPSTSSPQRS